MKTQSILKTALCVAGLLAAAMTGAQAQIINVQLGHLTGAVNMTGTSYSSTAAPLAYTGSTWNVYSAVSDTSAVNTGTSLLDSNGNATTVGFVAGIADAGQNGGAQTLPILSTYDYAGAHGGNITLSGLNSADLYNFVFMAPSSGFFGGETITSGSQSDTLSVNGNDSTWANGQNFVELTNLAPVFNATNNDYEIVITAGLGTNGYTNISGFQLAVAPSVPELGSLALMGLGALALLFVSRRRTA